MKTMAKAKKMTDWEQCPGRLPPGWADAVSDLAHQINAGERGLIRYVYAVAIDMVLTLRPEEVRRRAVEMRDLHETNFPGLVRRHALPGASARQAVEDAWRSSESRQAQTR